MPERQRDGARRGRRGERARPADEHVQHGGGQRQPGRQHRAGADPLQPLAVPARGGQVLQPRGRQREASAPAQSAAPQVTLTALPWMASSTPAASATA